MIGLTWSIDLIQVDYADSRPRPAPPGYPRACGTRPAARGQCMQASVAALVSSKGIQFQASSALGSHAPLPCDAMCALLRLPDVRWAFALSRDRSEDPECLQGSCGELLCALLHVCKQQGVSLTRDGRRGGCGRPNSEAQQHRCAHAGHMEVHERCVRAWHAACKRMSGCKLGNI